MEWNVLVLIAIVSISIIAMTLLIIIGIMMEEGITMRVVVIIIGSLFGANARDAVERRIGKWGTITTRFSKIRSTFARMRHPFSMLCQTGEYYNVGMQIV